MNLDFRIDDHKLRKSFDQWSKAFGDSNVQAVSRLAVSMAIQTAILVTPRGKSKKQIVENIATGANANIVGLAASAFSKIAKSKRPAFKFGSAWSTLDQSQILRSVEEVNAFIEANRGKQHGRVKKLPPARRAICKSSDLKKVITLRKKLAGKAKGSFLGAGVKAATWQRGGNRLSVGKNQMAWAQKHADLGRATLKKSMFNPEARIISLAGHTRSKRILPPDIIPEASKRAWKNVLKFYQISLHKANQ